MIFLAFNLDGIYSNCKMLLLGQWSKEKGKSMVGQWWKENGKSMVGQWWIVNGVSMIDQWWKYGVSMVD